MKLNKITDIVIDKAITIHKNIGPGLFESAYETILAYQLKKDGLQIKRQVHIPFVYHGVQLDKTFVADLIVEDKVILEIKSTEENHSLHRKQLLTYLRISDKKLGLVLNFGMGLMLEGISRVVNNL